MTTLSESECSSGRSRLLSAQWPNQGEVGRGGLARADRFMKSGPRGMVRLAHLWRRAGWLLGHGCESGQCACRRCWNVSSITVRGILHSTARR